MISIAKPNHIKRIHPTKLEGEEARRLVIQRDVPFGDALHAILARNHEALLVSMDRHFDKLKDVTQAKVPRDLV